MSDELRTINLIQGWLKVKLPSQVKWHRKYCRIDWDKAILLLFSKVDGQSTGWIKLLPNIFINEVESQNEFFIEIKVDGEIYSLQTTIKSEFDLWILALKRTAFSRVGGAIFGQSLEETYYYSLDKTSLVPSIVRQCCEYLLNYGSNFVGLFRIPGKQSSIKELRDRYDRGLTVQLDSSHSPATISSLLKIYLQSLPDSVIPVDSFDDFLQIGCRLKYNQNDDLDSLKELIEKNLRPICYSLLGYLCTFLNKLTKYQHETKMDAENLALTFGNNLIRSSEKLDLNMIKGQNFNLLPLIKVLITQSDFLFPNCSTIFDEVSDCSSRSLLTSIDEKIVEIDSNSEKKTKTNLINKVGKSFGHLRNSMTKAFLSDFPQYPSIRKRTDFYSLETTVEKEIRTLTNLIDEKDFLLLNLRKICDEQREKYQEEKSQLNQLIGQLEKENSFLKSHQQSNSTDI